MRAIPSLPSLPGHAATSWLVLSLIISTGGCMVPNESSDMDAGSVLDEQTTDPDAGNEGEDSEDGGSDSPLDGGVQQDGSSLDAAARDANGMTADASGATPDSGSGVWDSGARTDAGQNPWVLQASAVCLPVQGACEAPMAESATYATLRKDQYFPTNVYAEDVPEPVHGGRVHVAAMAAVGGRVQRVLINGVDADSILTAGSSTPPFEWTHVWPETVVAGEPVWVAFHSRNPSWVDGAQATLRIETNQGVAVDASIHVAISKAPLTYVTTLNGGTHLAVHLRSGDAQPMTLERLLVNGRDVTGTACIPDMTLAPGEAVMWTVPLCTPLQPGMAYTVVAQWQGRSASVGVGRVLPERFTLETWNNTDECPYPSRNREEYQRLKEAGIDTIYFQGDTCDRCGCDLANLLSTELPTTPDLHAVVAANPPNGLANTSRIAAFATGDESDGELYDDSGVPVAAQKAQQSRRAWSKYPEVPTFNGGKTNRNVGTFAGMADIQGMDFYIAACAPHITAWGTHPPARAAYDYLANARRNHMPWPTWLYAQGLSPAWNQEQPLTGNTVHVQPDPGEIWMQGASVVAAGAKGLMWFQTNHSEAEHSPERWKAIQQVTRTVRALRPLLREGDPTGDASTEGEAIVESILSREALVVVIINQKSSEAPTDPECLVTFLSESMVPHWRFSEQRVDVRIDVPRQLGIRDIFELRHDGIRTPPSFEISGRVMRFPSVSVDHDQPARFLVLATSGEVRTQVAAGLGR